MADGTGSGAIAEGMSRPLKRIVKPQQAAKLERAFGMQTVGDLLWHLPRRYAKRGELTPLKDLVPGEHVTVVARVQSVSTRTTSRTDRRGNPMKITSVVITDGTNSIDLAFFGQHGIENRLPKGTTALFSGTVGVFQRRLQFAHPDFEAFDEQEGVSAAEWAATPIPIYPATAQVTTQQLQKLVAQVLTSVGEIPDAVPASVRKAPGLQTLDQALRGVHQPASDAEAHRARHTIAWQEAFVLQTYLLATRDWLDSFTTQARLPGALLERFDSILPFRLTDDQAQASDAILADLASGTAMHRLVQGEVGSGKTVVALRAMLAAAESGGQSALLAPTEVLAAQHVRSIARMLGPELAAELQPTLLTGQMPASDRKRAALSIAAGQARIVVGTHALLSETTTFAELALVVVDEQHRFGVAQREALRSKGVHPHTLVLTATPIPRTVAMTAFGDLDVSTIRSLPAGRANVSTFVVDRAEHPAHFHRIWERMGEEVAAGRQAFVVCPAISPGNLEGVPPAPSQQDHRTSPHTPFLAEKGVKEEVRRQVDDVETTLRQVRQVPALEGRRVEALTGAMTSEEKDRVMRAFASGDIDVLVATTVIEVGVDVPNASMMVVLSADRFGVSQLHQLRGRIGRGAHEGLAMLVTEAEPLTASRERLDAVAATRDGFELAEVDLEQRGEGDVLGNAQSGVRSGLRVLRVTKDGRIIEAARQAAREVLDDDPKLLRHRALKDAVAERLDPDARAALATG